MTGDRTAGTKAPPPSNSAFPADVYKETVLAPLFDSAKTHHAAGLARINRAHCVMLVENGILGGEDGGAILDALDTIDAEFNPATIAHSGDVEDFFFHVEGELRRHLDKDVAGRLHTGRSRNDIDHTLFRMAIKDRLDATSDLARTLARAILGTADRERGTLIIAYTHGQPAQPTTFGHYLAAALEVLLRDLDRLGAARAVVDLCPMGAAAITTTGFPIDRHRMAELLGFAAPLENSYGCIAAVDYITATYTALKLVFLHLGRLVQDLQQWTSAEVGQLEVPDAFVQISSIMPQKRNPVPIEHLRLLASLTVGRADTVVNVMHNTPFTDMNDSEGEVQAAGYAAFDSGDRALRLLAEFIPALTVNHDRVRRNGDAACVTITELADELVRHEKLAFRAAHEIAAAAAKAVIGTGRGLGEGAYEAFAAAFAAVVGRPTGIDQTRFADITTLDHFVAVRDRFGGPAPAALAPALSGYLARLDHLDAAARVAAERQANAHRMLCQASRAMRSAA